MISKQIEFRTGTLTPSGQVEVRVDVRALEDDKEFAVRGLNVNVIVPPEALLAFLRALSTPLSEALLRQHGISGDIYLPPPAPRLVEQPAGERQKLSEL